MIRILECITHQHDLRLVALAVIIGVLVSYTAASLLTRASRLQTGSRHILFVTATVVTGFGIWTIHFVSMLAYENALQVRYDPTLTLASIAIAMLVTAASFHVALRPNMAAFGGGLFGIAVVLMHYTGMKALQVVGTVSWDHQLVTISALSGIALGTVSIWILMNMPGLWGRLAGCISFVLTICCVHYVGMTAYTVSYSPLADANQTTLPFNWLAVTVSAIALFIVAIAMTGSLVDQFRSDKEAEKLRAHILELMQTKRALETTTEELAMALKEAAAANEAKSQFLATMSHELRTPLNAIIGFSEILSSELFGPLNNDRYKEYAHDIQDSGAHLLSLINDILDLSRVDAGLLHLREETTDLTDILKDSLRMVEQQATQEQIALYNQTQSLSLPVHVDPQRIRQILINILSNAVKFTPAGGSITVSAEMEPEGILVRVTDTGIGIAPDDIPKALERFGQVDSKLSRKYEGCGLGLPLSKALMELHGGELRLESTLNEGTTVLLTFPHSRIMKEVNAA